MAAELVPASPWTYTTGADGTSKEHVRGAAVAFVGGRGDVSVPASLCQTGVDHFILGMEAHAGLEECVLYNNYVAFPMECRNQDGKSSSGGRACGWVLILVNSVG